MINQFVENEIIKLIPAGRQQKIEYIDEIRDGGEIGYLYWLDNGLYAYQFEIEKIKQ